MASELERTVKVRWEGYARGRIHEYNGGYSNEDSDLVCAALERYKTLVACETLAEAEALRSELTSYDSGQRTWMNSSQDRALARVMGEIDEQMADMGWGVLRTARGEFKAYVPEAEVEERQAEVNQQAREYREAKAQNEQRARDVTAEVREALEAREDVRSARTRITGPDNDAASLKVRVTDPDSVDEVVAQVQAAGYEDYGVDTTFENSPQIWADVPAEMMAQEQEQEQEQADERTTVGDLLATDPDEYHRQTPLQMTETQQAILERAQADSEALPSEVAEAVDCTKRYVTSVCSQYEQASQ